MSAAAVRRMLDALFRRWPFYLAMVLGFLALGIMNVMASSDEYTSTGSLFVDSQSLVSAQSGVRESGIFTFLSPAQFTSQELSGLISTDVFMEAAVERAGVDLADSPILRADQVSELRAAVGSFAASENLVAVSVTTPDPELSFRMAEGVIAEFIQFQITLDVAESNASEAFFADLVEEYREELVAARAEVEASLRGVSDLEELSPERQLEVQRLQAAESLAEERFLEAAANVEASRLATLQAETDVQQSYSVFDPPTLPGEPNGSVFAQIMLVAIFLAIGLFLALVGPIAAALLNRAVIFPDDLDLGHGLGVVAVLPKAGRKELNLDGATVSPDWGNDQASAESLGQSTITFLPSDDDNDVAAAIAKQVATVESPRPPSPPPDADTEASHGGPSAGSVPAPRADADTVVPAADISAQAATTASLAEKAEIPAADAGSAPDEAAASPPQPAAVQPPGPPGPPTQIPPPPPPVGPPERAASAPSSAADTLHDEAEPFTIAAKPEPADKANGDTAADGETMDDLLATREIGDLPPSLSDASGPARTRGE